jgi:putative spermidine/putrescine transport system substrate-binding protein
VVAAVVVVAIVAGALYYYVSTTQKSSQTLTIGTWGGLWATALQPIANQFTQQTGIKVVFSQYAGPSALVLATLKAEAPNYKIDVILAGESVSLRAANAGYTVPLNSSAVPSLSNVPDQYQGRVNGTLYYAGIYSVTDEIAYRSDKVPAPSSIHDLLNPAYKGKIAVPQPIFSPGEMLTQFAMANGGNETNIQPGFTFATQLANSGNLAYVYPDDATVKNLLSTGQAYAAWGITSDFYDLNQSGVPIQVVKHFSDAPTIIAFDTVSVVKGPNEKAAMQFVSFFLNPTNNGQYASTLGLNPVNSQSPLNSSLSYWGLTSSEAAQYGYHVDPSIVAKNADNWTQQWNTQVVPLVKPPS